MLGKGNMSCCQMIPFPSHEGVKVRAVLTSRVNTFGSWLFKINVSVIMECPIYSLGCPLWCSYHFTGSCGYNRYLIAVGWECGTNPGTETAKSMTISGGLDSGSDFKPITNCDDRTVTS